MCLFSSKISKIVMHEFWYDFVRPKYVEKIKVMLYA